MKIQHKRSAALDGSNAKEPTAAQTDFGEVCVNFNTQDPALFIRDNADNIVRVGGDLSLYQKIENTPPPVFVCASDEINAQSPPAGRLEGTLWWNTEAGILYVWYIDDNSSQWVIAVPQNSEDTYLSKTDDDNAKGEITFEKLTTHAAGVEVTGGTCPAVGMGIAGGTNLNLHSTGKIQFNQNCNTQLNISGLGRVEKNMENLVDTGTGMGIRAHGAIPTGVGATEISLFNAQAQVDTGHTSPKVSGFKSQPNSNLQSVGEYYGFYHISSPDIADKTYGFYSAIYGGTSGKNYNFYAEGNAPNYFAGNTQFGSTPGSDPLQGGNLSTFTPGSNNFIQNIARSSNSAGAACLGLNRSGNDRGRFISFLYNNTVTDAIEMDGSGGVRFGTTSDYRAKENIVDLPSAVNQIKALRPVNFNYTWASGKTRPGFIAHEVAEALPVAVVGEKDETEAIGTLADWDGTELETNVVEPEELTYTEEVETDGVATMVTRTRSWSATGNRDVYQGVDQTKLIPLLTKALQEALDRIEQLESNTLQPLYASLADLPSATDHHGKVAHVHSEGALYFAHSGNWVKLQNA